MGRPTKWNRAMEEKALEYIENYADHGDMIPSAVGMALELGVSESTLYKWAEDGRGRFSEILRRCVEKQQRVLINGGLSGGFNSAITKLVLGKHGYHEKVDNTLSGPGGGPVQVHPIEMLPVKSIEKNTDSGE